MRQPQFVRCVWSDYQDSSCNGLICWQDYWSSSLGPPPKDGTQNYNLIAASQSGVNTVVEFSRDAVTGDNAKDVQFTVRSY